LRNQFETIGSELLKLRRLIEPKPTESEIRTACVEPRGRKRKLSDYQRAEAIKRRAAGETLTSIAKSYGVHLSMASRL